jgi:hypothetical protein
MVRRWSEYSADLSAALAGYGWELKTLLASAGATEGIWKQLTRFWIYPSRRSRLRRLERVLVDLTPLIRTEEFSPGTTLRDGRPGAITWGDYVYSIFLRVIPVLALLASTMLLFIAAATSVGRFTSVITQNRPYIIT